MQQIIDAYRKTIMKQRKGGMIFCIAGICIVCVAIMTFVEAYLPISAAGIFASVAAGILIMKAGVSEEKLKIRIENRLLKENDRETFFASVTEEMANGPADTFQNNCYVTMYEDLYEMSLFVTKTWFVFVFDRDAIIRRRKELAGYEIVSAVSRCEEMLEVMFTDGHSFLSPCEGFKEELIDILKKAEGDKE